MPAKTPPSPPQLPILKRYPRVIAVVSGASRFRGDAKLQGVTLADVAPEIPKFREFCSLCSADMFDTWCNDRDRKVRTTDNRCDTWERFYRHWYAHHGTKEHPPAIKVRSVGRTGSYVVAAAIERRSAERLWSSVAKACRAAKIPQHIIEEFQRANEHFFAEYEAAALASASAAAPGAAAGTPPGTPSSTPPTKSLASPTNPQ